MRTEPRICCSCADAIPAQLQHIRVGACNRELRWNVGILGLCMLARCGPLLLSLLDSCIAALYAECTMTDGVQALGGNQFEQLMEAIRGTQTRFVEKLEEFKGEVRQCQYRGYTFRKKGNEAQTSHSTNRKIT